MRYILPFILLLTIKAFGVTNPPNLLRACIDYEKKLVTISWKAPSDVCGSFTKYDLYAKENSGAYFLLATIPDRTVTEYPHQLADENTAWSYYITVSTLCDGISSATSQVISIDIAKPPVAELDSVSYSLDNQDIIAGWTPNPALDTKEYKVFDYSTGNADSIGITSQTNYVISKNPASRFPTVITTLDSCNISSLRSSPHTPAFLNHKIDTCLREIYLSWQLYSGWSTIDKQEVYVSKNQAGFIKHQRLNGSTKSLTFSDFILGDELIFYVRSYTKDSTITSSSNKITIQTRELIVPNYLYLDNVTVDQNSENIELTWHGENTHDIVEYNIHRSDNNIDFNQLFTETNTASSFETKVDYSADPNTQSYYYQIEGLNKCNEVVVQSQVSQSIFLTLEPINDHNEYINWSGGVEEYQLQKENNVSTWNIIQSSSMPITQKPYNDSSGCYRILATEIINQFGHSQTSYSNVVCVIDELKAFVTTAINPTSENNTFKIIGEGIDHSKSSYQIFNRWGEMIAEQPTNQSWDATYQGTQVPPGVYVYIVNLTGLLGETETQKGIVNVIR